MKANKQQYTVTFKEKWTERISSKVFDLTSKRVRELSHNMVTGIPICVYSKALAKLTGGNQTHWVLYIKSIDKVN